jgi:ribosomal protein S18 acetylase RimI-like enzyme
VPWGGDLNCAVGVQVTDLPSFERIAREVERIHQEKGLGRPDRYDLVPPPLDESPWAGRLEAMGYRLQRSIWFCAQTRRSILPTGLELCSPAEDAYIEWYGDRQRTQDWYVEAEFEILRPLQQGFARVFRPYWLFQSGLRVGWVYCAWLGEYGSLFDVWIEPVCRGQELGRALMDAIRAEGIGHDARHILLRTSKGRRGFYEACGFRECLQSSTIRR